MLLSLATLVAIREPLVTAVLTPSLVSSMAALALSTDFLAPTAKDFSIVTDGNTPSVGAGRGGRQKDVFGWSVTRLMKRIFNNTYVSHWSQGNGGGRRRFHVLRRRLAERLVELYSRSEP